jgi:hypothetical protein
MSPAPSLLPSFRRARSHRRRHRPALPAAYGLAMPRPARHPHHAPRPARTGHPSSHSLSWRSAAALLSPSAFTCPPAGHLPVSGSIGLSGLRRSARGVRVKGVTADARPSLRLSAYRASVGISSAYSALVGPACRMPALTSRVRPHAILFVNDAMPILQTQARKRSARNTACALLTKPVKPSAS